MHVRSLSWEDPLEKEMTTYAWRIPWTEEPGRLQSIGLQRVGQDKQLSTQDVNRALGLETRGDAPQAPLPTGSSARPDSQTGTSKAVALDSRLCPLFSAFPSSLQIISRGKLTSPSLGKDSSVVNTVSCPVDLSTQNQSPNPSGYWNWLLTGNDTENSTKISLFVAFEEVHALTWLLFLGLFLKRTSSPWNIELLYLL